MKIRLLILLLTITGLSGYGQNSYGGSAYAYVKDKDGNTRVINVTWPCTHDDETDAKSRLKSSIENLKYSDEEFSSGVYYSINADLYDDGKSFGGSAWVEVRDENGRTRVLNEEWPCTADDIGKAKDQLLMLLNLKKSDSEEFSGWVHYDIDSCN